jgi:hypothetical protein
MVILRIRMSHVPHPQPNMRWFYYVTTQGIVLCQLIAHAAIALQLIYFVLQPGILETMDVLVPSSKLHSQKYIIYLCIYLQHRHL